MSLTLALNNALSGLNVNKQSLAVLSQNIANANNPDYTRKIVSQSAQYVDGNGSGVRVEEISRKVDQYLQQAIQLQQGNLGKSSVLDTYADRLQALIGKPGANNSIDTYVTSFFGSLQSLAENPDSSSNRLSAVNGGVQLAANVSGLAKDIQGLRFQADQEILQTTNDVNGKLKLLYDVNTALANAHALGQPQGELLDKRDQLTKDIAQNLDINIFYRENGTVQVYSGSGATLLDANLYQLSYANASSVESFSNDSSLAPINVYRADKDGVKTGDPTVLVMGGTSSQIVSTLTTGKIRGLMDLRDQKLPATLDQLDLLASNIRDTVNEIHNAGTGYPGAASLTGERPIDPRDPTQWKGSVRIALLDAQGKPLASPYASDPNGLAPLTLDLSKLDGGQGYGAGKPSTQTIIDEINRYYGAPQNQVTLPPLNNIQLASNSRTIPDESGRFSFDFDLQNLSAGNADFFVSNIRVLDDTNTNITSVNSTIPSVALNATNAFTTTNGSNTVTVTTAAPHGFVNGQRITLGSPGAAINGIPASSFNQSFIISNVTPTGFDITLDTAATSTGSAAPAAGQQVFPKYATIEAGQQTRTTANGGFSIDLSGNTTSSTYTIMADVAVADGNGGVKYTTVSYKINNNEKNQFNARYGANAVSGQGSLVTPAHTGAYAQATLVDKDGKELLKDAKGTYYPNQQGFLKIATVDGNTFLAIDSMDSQQQGLPFSSPPVAATNKGFSSYFGLNDFFSANAPTVTGDTVKNSAVNLKVQDRLSKNPNLLSTGSLTQSRELSDTDKTPRYTYELSISDNATIQKLAGLKQVRINFSAAGGLGETSQTLAGYGSQMLGYASADAANIASAKIGAQQLLDGFTQRSTAISGVNLDEELANTVIYQNAYAASARVITVANDLFDTLLKAF